MLFSKNDQRFLYAKSPLIEVICQLRFPTILSIGTEEPVQFQELIRGKYPRYMAQNEPMPPKVINGAVKQQTPVINYNFISEDGKWKVNLTNSFIALSTHGYSQWEDFAQRLDFILAGFIDTYQPSFFERIGLRYINAFSRRTLGLEGYLWADLISSAHLGVLGELDINEAQVSKCSLDVEMPLEGGCRLKMHSGPGLMKTGKTVQTGEVRFILDADFSSNGKQQADQIPDRLEELHGWANKVFEGAMTDTLRDAMEPMPL